MSEQYTNPINCNTKDNWDLLTTLKSIFNVSNGSINTVPSCPNGSPSNLVLTVVSNTSIKIDWTNGSTNEDNLQVWRSTDGITYTLITSPLAGLNTYTNIGLTANFYYYKVCAIKGECQSDFTSVVVNSVPLVVYNTAQTVAWYNSQLLSTITKDGANAVSRWNDRLGSGHDLIQATGTNQPLWVLNDGVLFDSVDNFMKCATFPYIQPEFIYIVLKQVTWIDGKYILDGNEKAFGSFLGTPVTPSIKAYAGIMSEANNNLAVNTFAIVRLLFNGAGSKLQVNSTAAVTWNCGVFAMDGFTLGKAGAGLTTYSNIQVKEIILRNTADSAQNEADIYTYLKLKHGL